MVGGPMPISAAIRQPYGDIGRREDLQETASHSEKLVNHETAHIQAHTVILSATSQEQIEAHKVILSATSPEQMEVHKVIPSSASPGPAAEKKTEVK